MVVRHFSAKAFIHSTLEKGNEIRKWKTLSFIKKRFKQMGQAEWNKINEISQLRTRRFHRVDDLLWVNSSVSGFKPFIVKGIQKVKASLFYKSNIARLVFRLFIEGEETLYNAATKLSGGWRPCCVVCSKYMGLLTTSRKNCLLFDQHCVDGKSHRPPHKYHILCVPGVYSLESFVCAGVFWNSWELGICVFEGNHAYTMLARAR